MLTFFNMSDLTNIPKQSYFSAELQSPIDSSQTSDIILTAVPDYTPSGETVWINVLDPDNPETISVTGWNSSTKVLSGVTRGVDTYTGESATGSAHAGGTQVVISNDWNLFLAIQTAVNSKFDTAGGTITGATDFSGASTTFRIPNLTTAEKTALASPANGMLVYDTTLGEFQFYDGGAWQSVGTASVPNASPTVAGIVEIATNAEMGAGTGTGGTGALLVPPNSELVKTSSGAGDENKIAVLNASGEFADGFMGAAESGNSVVVKSKSDGSIDDSLLKLTTAGDTVYSDGTDLQRLAIGSYGQALITNSGATAPEWGRPSGVVGDANGYFTYQLSQVAGDWSVTDASISVQSPAYFDVQSSGDTWYGSSNIPGLTSDTVSDFGDGKNYITSFRARATNGTTGDRRIGIADAAAFPLVYNSSTADFAGFATDGTTLYAVTADAGVGATATDVSSGITVTNWNMYRVEFNAGTNVLFYVNETLVATHTTNLPDSGSVAWGAGGTTNTEDWQLSSVIFSQEL